MNRLFSLGVNVLMCSLALADVRLPAILSNDMVIQRDVPSRIWGWADEGESVTVTCGDFKQTVVAKDKTWQVMLPPHVAGKMQDIVVTGKNTLSLHNLLAGDVWICSGQSNMQRTVKDASNAEAEIAQAKYPQIRLFAIPAEPNMVPQTDCKGHWEECSPETVAKFSAVGYFFGRELHTTLGAPIGLVAAKCSGTPAEAWTPADMMAADPSLAPLLDAKAQYEKEYPQRQQKYERRLAAMQKAAATQPAGDGPVRGLRPPDAPEKESHMPAALYNGLIHPLTPMRIKGVIWYQGEANAVRAAQYRTLLPALIQGWRKAWGQGDFPFGIVQLANYGSSKDLGWPGLREAQALTAASLPNCGLAVIIDVGERDNIHPANKLAVGHRLALWALAKVYGRDVIYSGPTLDPGGVKIDGDAIRIGFQNAAGGLKTRDGAAPSAFTIAGKDGRFHPAQATIDGQSVVLRSSKVPAPVDVRYAWANAPECNLQNSAGLPAAPFRTDKYPIEDMAGLRPAGEAK